MEIFTYTETLVVTRALTVFCHSLGTKYNLKGLKNILDEETILVQKLKSNVNQNNFV